MTLDVGQLRRLSDDELARLLDAHEAWLGQMQDSISPVDLSEVYFLRTDLRGRNLTRARLKGSAFAATQLRGATFNHADCESAAFWAVDLSDVSFRHANLRGVDFGAETLEISDVVSFFPELPQVDERQLPPVRFRGVDLRHSELAGTCLRGLSLAGADLRGATGLVLDDNDIHEARLEGSDAEWPRLMSTYAGSRFAVHLLLLLAFLLPLILKVSFWSAIGRLQVGVGDVASESLVRLGAAVGSLNSAAGSSGCASCSRWRVWELLVGRDQGVFAVLTFAALATYNGLRGLLTIRVSSLRDRFHYAGRAPHFVDYRPLLSYDRRLRLLLIVAVVLFVTHLVSWLSTPVWLPTS